MNRGGRPEPAPPECALACEMFDHFCAAGTMKQILALHREICKTLTLRPTRLPDFYPKLKAKLSSSWKAQALFKKFDARANHKVYGKGRACAQNKVLIIGAGPCGLRAAIECQLLGAKVVVIEKRDRMSRNNVLHLWPFVIQDLRSLGAKKFFGKFCAGSIDHICIRQLQCILLKVCLLLGVEFHEGVSFEELSEPTVRKNSETLGWRARVQPEGHPVSQYEFDVLLGADGKRNTLQGFKRKEFRGKLAMAITANFINRHTEREAAVPEISGVAFIFNQKFFKDLYENTGIDLENIVYYKDDTHYFVMTAKKHSLLQKGVILKDNNEVSRLLSPGNVDKNALMRYAQEAARFSTNNLMPLDDFALNHYGEPDVALFDFTSMYAADNASMVYERHGRRLLCQLVGDSLLEPFWPTGSGCARGFLSALDAAWAVRSWGQTPTPHPLYVIAERESIYRLLAQTTPENLHRDFGAYTIDPGTRYPNLNRKAVTAHRVTSYYDSDEPLPLDAPASIRKRKRELEVSDEVLVTWVGVKEGGIRAAASPSALMQVVRRYRPELMPEDTPPEAVYQILHDELGIHVPNTSGGEIPDAKLRSFLTRVYNAFKGEVPHIPHESTAFDEIKVSMQKQQHGRHHADHPIFAYKNPVEAEKTPSSYKRKRRSKTQVSMDPVDYIRKNIGKLNLEDITQLARLIDGHDAFEAPESKSVDKQMEIREQILALLDPDESPDPTMVRESLARMLDGNSKVSKMTSQEQASLAYFFEKPSHKSHGLDESKPAQPRRRLKGLDPNTIKIPDFDLDAPIEPVKPPRRLKALQGIEMGSSFESYRSYDDPLVSKGSVNGRKKRSSSVQLPYRQSPEVIPISSSRRPSDVAEQRMRHHESPESQTGAHTRRMAQMFERNKSEPRYEPEPRSKRAGSVTEDMARRMQRMNDIIEGNARDVTPERIRLESIGNPELEVRRQRVVELIQGPKRRQMLEPQRRASGDNQMLSFRMQRVNDMMQKKIAESKRPKTGGRRKTQREIMKQRFEKSLQMLATEPRMEVSSLDLENDYGLQQYRASAPDFTDRVKKLERQLQHYEEGRIVGGGSRMAGNGAHVAKLAAELSGNSSNSTHSTPKSSKPKDLMRSVGKIEKDDWHVKEIEKKITENQLGRPEPSSAERVPKWDREQFLGRQRRLQEGDNEDRWGEIDQKLHKLGQKLQDSGRPDQGTKKVADLATKFIIDDPPKAMPRDETRKSWRGPSSAGVQCASCGLRVFAAEGVTADGISLHRACFRCAICKAALRPGNYIMERYGSRLMCTRHTGVNVPDAVSTLSAPQRPLLPATPERISLELSDTGAREIDEDEWTDRNFLASETSCAGGLSDERQSSSDEYADAGDNNDKRVSPELPNVPPRHHHEDMYFSDDSFGYDDFSDDGAESSGAESCSRMREAREARRREVPAEGRPSSYSSEVESEESESSESSDYSSATEVSTDSEFARDESAPPSLPAILVTEAPAMPLYQLSRDQTRRYQAPPEVPPRNQDARNQALRDQASHNQTSRDQAPHNQASRDQVPHNQASRDQAPHNQASRDQAPHNQTSRDQAPHNQTSRDQAPHNQASRDQAPHNQASRDQAPHNQTSRDQAPHNQTSRDQAPHNQTSRDQAPHNQASRDQATGDLPLSRTRSTGGLASKRALELKRKYLIGEGSHHAVKKSDSSSVLDSKFEAFRSNITEFQKMLNQAATSAPVRASVFTNNDSPMPDIIKSLCSDAPVDLLAKADSSSSNYITEKTEPLSEKTNARTKDEDLDSDSLSEDESSHTEPSAVPQNVPRLEVHDEGGELIQLDSLTIVSSSVEEVEKESGTTAVEVRRAASESSESGREASTLALSEPALSAEWAAEEPALVEGARRRGDAPRALPGPKLVHDATNAHVCGRASPPAHIPYSQALEHFEFADEGDQDPSIESPPTPKNEGYMELVDDEFEFYPGNDRSMNFIEDSFSETVVKPTQHDPNVEIVHTIPKEIEEAYYDSEIQSPRLETELSDKSFSENKLERNDSRTDSRASDEKTENKLLSMGGEPSNESLTITEVSPQSKTPPLFTKMSTESETPDEISPPQPADTTSKSSNGLSSNIPYTGASMRLYSPAICRSASDTFSRSTCSSECHARSLEAERDTTDKVQEIKRERDEQTEVVRRLVLERLGGARPTSGRRERRPRLPPAAAAPPPVPPPPVLPPPPPRPAPPLLPMPVTPSFSDPELARETRRKSIMKSISNYLNRHLGPRQKEPPGRSVGNAHKSMGALQETAPPVPPPPVCYSPPPKNRPTHSRLSGAGDEERDAMQLWFEARWARLVAQRRMREESSREEPTARRLARLERRLTRPLSAEQQAATVAELVQVSAQREAHQALMKADRRRSAASSCD